MDHDQDNASLDCASLPIAVRWRSYMYHRCNRSKAPGPTPSMGPKRTPDGREPYERKVTGLTGPIHPHLPTILLSLSLHSQLHVYLLPLKDECRLLNSVQTMNTN